MVDIDNDDDISMDVESVHDGRSASVASQPIPGPSRRGPRGPYKKGTSTSVAESIEADGHLPGAKDGLGAFPPGSDWARTVLQLKMKGKRYRTKKERLRIEKEGPPVLPEGSLDYAEMEDPFSVISFFVPEPPTKPYLTPLYPPLSASTLQSQSSGQSTPISQQPRSTFPTATSAPLTYTFSLSQQSPAPTLKRRYWTITRNPVSRTKGKERDDDIEITDIPAWQTPREAHTTDVGSFAVLAGELAQEMRHRGVSNSPGTGMDEDQSAMLDIIRNSLDCESSAKTVTNGSTIESAAATEESSSALFHAKDYWSLKRAAEAEVYLRDVVYGGVDGLAYIRSLAEFVTTYRSEDSATDYRTSTVFGVPLAQWVEREIVWPLTSGRHALLQQTAEQLSYLSSKAQPRNTSTNNITASRTVAEQVYLSLHVYPAAMVALSALLQIKSHKIDMGALIKAPEELFHSEEEWAGKKFRDQRKQKIAVKSESLSDTMDVETPTDSVDPTITNAKPRINDVESPEELKEVLEYVADAIVKQDQALRKRLNSTVTRGELATTKAEEHDEDLMLRNIRLNLLALAKRAPLDTIARLPKDLVPEHIRRFVPTLGGSV
ncbi:hypothetical protein AX14_012193 [Amanita brunnescens Koide BX004]|nr:hypothetical protein AX14_012193 [Amanita brunnescens Koide BX004]